MFIGPDIVGRERLTADEGGLRTKADRGKNFFWTATQERTQKADRLTLSEPNRVFRVQSVR